MVRKVWFNGAVVDYKTLTADELDRAWRYADGGFETIFFNGKEAPLYALHASRASQHAQAIGVVIQLPNEQRLNGILQDLAKQNTLTGTLRCRMTWFRNAGGFYLPSNDNGSVLIEAFPFDASSVIREQKAVLYNDQSLVAGKLSPYKKLGAHIHVDAARFAQLMEADDALLLNAEGKIAEATASNLVLRKGNVFYAPPVNDGGLEGVMLYYLAKQLSTQGYTFLRQSFTPDELMHVDEILTVNALRGICCITSLFGKKFTSNSLALNQKLPLSDSY